MIKFKRQQTKIKLKQKTKGGKKRRDSQDGIDLRSHPRRGQYYRRWEA